MRALGFPPAAVAALVLAEAAFLCGGGAILGSSLAGAALYTLRTRLPDLPPLALDGGTLSWAIALAAALAVLASLPPAWRVSRLSPAEALRRE
jgi:putative ABC transport system permease protein